MFKIYIPIRIHKCKYTNEQCIYTHTHIHIKHFRALFSCNKTIGVHMCAFSLSSFPYRNENARIIQKKKRNILLNTFLLEAEHKFVVS